MSDIRGYRSIANDAVPSVDWVPAVFIDMNWRDFSEAFGIEFEANDGTYEAPGPVAYAALEIEGGEVIPLEHHYEMFESKVIAFARRGDDNSEFSSRLAKGLGVSVDLIIRSGRP